MSKVEELLAKYNSKGISTIKLADILDYEQPSKYIVSSSDYDDNYDIPVLTAGQTFILGYTDEKDGVYKASKNNPTIIFDDFTTGHHWVDFDFKIKSSAMKMLRLKNNKSLLRYIFHSMALINYVPTEHSRQWISKYSQFEIPIPHIKVQEEIVKILDSFTNLIDALNEELSLRQKQFEYYREKLLTFDDNHDSISSVTMDDLFNFKNGYTPSTKNSEYWTNGEVNWFTVADFKKNNNVLYDSIKKVSISAVKGGKLFKPNSILLATTATIGIHALIRTEHLSNQQLTNLSLKKEYVDKIDIKYIYYYMFLIDEWCKKNYHGGGFMIVDMVGLKKQQIPIPSLSIQQSIVEKLDAFESLISSLKEEIALRQKQYEYYREKLLTFD